MPSANNPGKGDAPRPMSVTSEEYARRWSRAFRLRRRSQCTRCGVYTKTSVRDGMPGQELCNYCWYRQLEQEDV